MNIAQDTLKDKTLDLVESITPVKNLLETAKAEREENPYKDVDQFFANLRFGAVKSELTIGLILYLKTIQKCLLVGCSLL